MPLVSHVGVRFRHRFCSDVGFQQCWGCGQLIFGTFSLLADLWGIRHGKMAASRLAALRLEAFECLRFSFEVEGVGERES